MKDPALTRRKRDAAKMAGIMGHLAMNWVDLALAADRQGDQARGTRFEGDAARTAATAWHWANERMVLDGNERPADAGGKGGRA